MWDPRRWPWWGWLLAACVAFVCVVLSAAFAWREMGIRSLKAEIAQLQTAGRPALPGDLWRLIPPHDPERQERVWQLVSDASSPWLLLMRTAGMEARTTSGAALGDLAKNSQAMLDGSHSMRSQWRALHREGPVVVSLLGWLSADIKDPRQIGMMQSSMRRTPNLLTLRGLANALATEARLEADPRASLADLDALITATAHPGGIIDAMISMVIRRIRDSAYLEATLRGTDVEHWIQDCPSTLALLADGLIGERALLGGGLAQDAMQGLDLRTTRGNPLLARVREWMEIRHYWFTLAYDARLALETYSMAEDMCRTGVDRTKPNLLKLHDPWFSTFHRISALSLSNFAEAGTTAALAEVSARQYRLAALLVRHWRKNRFLPEPAHWADPQAHRLLAAQGLGPALIYERLSDTCLRISIDPHAPANDLLPAGRMDPVTTCTGAWKDAQGWIQLDLSQIANL
jgi:hypothetical protein